MQGSARRPGRYNCALSRRRPACARSAPPGPEHPTPPPFPPMTEEHSTPIKTPKQLVIVVLLAFAVPITLAVMVSQLVTSGDKGDSNNDNLVLRADPARRHRRAGRSDRPQGHAHRRTGLRAGVQDVPRDGPRRFAEARRQGRVGQDRRAGRQALLRARDRRHPRDAREGRQQRIDRRRGEARRRLHGEQGGCRLDGPGSGGRRGRTRRRGGAGRRRRPHGPAGRRGDVQQMPQRRLGGRAEDRRPRRRGGSTA